MNSHVMVIFGSTGDLCFNKLLPSLASLIKEKPNCLDAIILVGRQVKNIKEYELLALERGLSQTDFNGLSPHLHYVHMQSTDLDDYGHLSKQMQSYSHRYFYIATPPSMYPIILENLTKASLFKKQLTHHRIAFEKPFGENGLGSNLLNDLVHQHSDEKQIFRVDHYLAKPLIRELVSIREKHPKWNRLLHAPALKKVTVTAFETLGILSRGKFYDQTGAIHDMIQSHLFETLALAVMPLPHRLDVASLQQAKVQFFKSLVLDPLSVILGQYDSYRRELNVLPDSMTETFAHVSFTSSLPQFKNTIFTIQTGKRLSKKLTEIRFEFETVTVVFNVSPLLKVKWTVMEGKESQPHDFESLRSYSFINEEAYVKIFKDFIAGDQTLFPSAMEIEATWKLVDQIKRLNRLPKLYQHEKDLLGEQYE